MLPAHFLKFYFIESFIAFTRIWHNLMLVLEEDLGVGIMVKLLFVPLFHDSTFVGRIISFIFRLSRIVIGLFAFFSATLTLLLAALFWYLAPVLAVITLFNLPQFSALWPLQPFFVLILLFSLALFLHHLSYRPLKRIWQVHDLSKIWEASKVKKESCKWDNLIKTDEVRSLLESMEFEGKNFSSQNIAADEKVIQKAWELAIQTGAPYLTPAYFFVAMLSIIPGVEEELLKIDLKLESFVGALNFLEHKRAKWRKVYLWDEDFGIKHLKGVNRGWLSAPTPMLDECSVDLTRLASAQNMEDFVGRESVVSQAVTILSQIEDRNVLLVGPAGAGKTTLVNYLAKLIIIGDAPEALATKRVVALDPARLLSNVTTEGELAKKIKTIFEEVAFVEDVIIFIDEIHNLGIGQAGTSFNLYSLILPYLESVKFQFIGSTEEENYARILEKNSSFVRIFNKVEVPPATVSDTRKIVFERALELAKNRKIFLSYLAINEIVQGSARLIHERVLPDSALALLLECVVLADEGKITSQIVKKVLEKKVNIPVIELDQSQKQLLLHLEDIIHENLIDQEQAVKAVAQTLRRGAVELRESTRPIGSFLFVGPTGVGKTELAKILSSTYFINRGAFIRFDMSEYQNDDALNRLVGTMDEPGELTQAVRNKPYALVLLDEFEKANPKILNLFLQVLEDGRLTDGMSHVADFTNTIIIATSNAASVLIANELEKGVGLEIVERSVKEELLKIFKPELVNRFDSIVIFKPLSQPDLERVVRLKLVELKNILKEKGYIVAFTPELISELARRGFDPVLGARPLRRLIQDTIESKLSEKILLNELQKGEETVLGTKILNP